MILALLGCDPAGDSGSGGAGDALEVRIVAPVAGELTDECADVCFTIEVTENGAPATGAEVDVELRDWGFAFFDMLTRDDGLASYCTYGIPAGTHEFVAVATHEKLPGEVFTAEGSLTVAPFGHAMGFDRSTEIIEELPYIPKFQDYPGNPVLPPTGDEADFDAVGTILPTVATDGTGYFMWYAGQQILGEDYLIGAAASDDGFAWERLGLGEPGVPSGIEGDWKYLSTNSPFLMLDGDEWRLYYTGRREESGNLSIGLATSTEYAAQHGSAGSAYKLSDLPPIEKGGENPVLDHIDAEELWGGDAVAHPSVVKNPQGFYEMWYSTGRHRVGYALSPDGLDWTHYCNNPVLLGESEAGNWELGRVKSTEVAMLGDYYLMAYTGGDTGYFQVGWAMSLDGIHWTKAENPVLAPDAESSWKNQSTIGASLMVDEAKGLLRTWYSGTYTGGGNAGSAVGYAEAELPTSLP
ncbi:MAG: hypothetical protein FJ102_07000 [Deltaproteobacteria bacterium]|nr:hypothetical protein [Deltaproteobacteria bacterium]